MLTLQVESLTSKLIDFAIERRGPAPVAWAWLALGSAARREFTLASDQENALAYADGDDAATRRHVLRALRRGCQPRPRALPLRPRPNHVLARSSLWRMSESAWIRTFEECLVSPDRSHLIRATVAFDFRQIAGGLPIDAAPGRRPPPWPARIPTSSARSHAPRPTSSPRSAFADRWPRREIDLKRRGVIPITNIARFHALANGITISGTDDRLVRRTSSARSTASAAAELREAAVVIARIRYDHQLAQIQTRLTPDNVIDPEVLAPLARAHLRDAFLAVSRAQKQLGVHRPIGI